MGCPLTVNGEIDLNSRLRDPSSEEDIEGIGSLREGPEGRKGRVDPQGERD